MSQHQQGKLSKLSGAVQRRVNDLVSSGKVTLSELDAQVLQKLASSREEVALEALHQFAQSDMGKIHNKAGFLSSVIKRVDMERMANLSRGNPAIAHQHHAAMAAQQQQHHTAVPYAPGGGYPQHMLSAGYPPPQQAQQHTAGGAQDPVLLAKADELIRRGVIGPTDLDARVWDSLRELGTGGAMLALDRLGNSDTSHVRNRVGFLMGACWCLL